MKILKIFLNISILLFSAKLFALPVVNTQSYPCNNKILFSYIEKSRILINKHIRSCGFFYIKSDSILDNEESINITINIYQTKNFYHGELKFSTTNSLNYDLPSGIHVKSKILSNIPLMLAKNIVLLHRNIPFTCNYEGQNGIYTYNFGKYSFMSETCLRMIYTKNGKIISQNRYNTKVSITKPINIVIQHKHKFTKPLNQLNSEIAANTNQFYSLRKLPSGHYNSLFIQDLFIINPLSNILIPGIGSYLTVQNFGFSKPKASYLNITLTASTYMYQLFYVPYLNSFENSFWPWSNNYSENTNLQNLHKFNIITIPMTFTISFLDHLTLNCLNNKIFPPFFTNINNNALVYSILFPGGGMYYKGYRTYGFMFYATEFTLASLFAYNYQNTLNNKYFYALLSTKLIENIVSYAIPSNFSFYNQEFDNGTQISTFPIINSEDHSLSFNICISKSF